LERQTDILDPTELNKVDLNQIDAELCKRSFYYFVKTFWETFDTKKPIWNWHVKYICDRLQVAGLKVVNEEKRERDIYIAMPPGIGKSNILLLFNAWLWALKPSIKLIGASYSMSISASELSFKARQIISSEKYKLYFPFLQIMADKSAESNFHNTKGGSRFSTSIDATITGKRADVIIVDDPLNVVDIHSQKDRDKASKFVDDLSTRKISHDYALTIVCQQRLHRDDVIGHLLSQGNNAEYICLPAQYHKSLNPSGLKSWYDKQGGLLFPERLSFETLEDERRKSLRSFNAQFLQSPSDDSDSVLKEAWFPVINKEEFEKIREKGTFDYFIDTAFTANRKRDPSVILCASKIGNNIYLTGLSRVWKEVPQMIEHIKIYTAANGYTMQSRIFIEPASSGIGIIQTLKQETDLNVISSSAQNKLGKLERVDMISPTVQAGRVVLVKGDWVKLFLGEVCVPESDHDDIKDVLCMAVAELLTKPRGSGKYYISFA